MFFVGLAVINWFWPCNLINPFCPIRFHEWTGVCPGRVLKIMICLRSGDTLEKWGSLRPIRHDYSDLRISFPSSYHHKKSCVTCWQGTSRSFAVALSIKQTKCNSSQPAHQARCEPIGQKVSLSSQGRLSPPLGAGCNPPGELVPLHKGRIDKS
jgi:hypothetical protein